MLQLKDLIDAKGVEPPKVKNYDEASKEFSTRFNSFLQKIVEKLNRLTTKTEEFNSTSLTLKDNTIHVYKGSGLSSLNISYPEGNFISTILFSTASSGEIIIRFPSGTTFMGSDEMKFFPAENWELNIHNGRVVGAQIFQS